MQKIKIEMCNCENTLLNELAFGKITRNNIAITYAFTIISSETINWNRINKAIIKRWSVNGLNYIKKRAWDNIKVKSLAITNEVRDGKS